ncbi:MAG: MFS transporter [Gemmatimonadales bacterium]
MSAQPLSRNVRALAAVSLLSDAASEMIYPLLPVFLSGVLGASASVIGGIEGAAESTAAMLKLASGWWSDRVRRRKPLVVAGYVIGSAVRPLIGLAAAPWHVLVVRLSDRVGKGIRTSPRDALIADSTEPALRGRAFGFNRAGDNLGAVIGPLVAWVMLQWNAVPLRTVFFWAAVPGVLTVAVLVLFVKEQTATAEPRITTEERRIGADTALGTSFWRYMLVLLVFTLGNSSDAFLLLRASQVGVPTAMVPILWAAFNLVKSVASTPGGTLSDRVGRRPLIVAGWLVYAAVYFVFGHATAQWQVWMLFLVYGLYFGLTEGVEKAMVADLVPAARRGTAFGWYNFTIGLAALPASLMFGLVWDRVSPVAAFTLGATLAVVAAAALLTVVPRSPPRA